MPKPTGSHEFLKLTVKQPITPPLSPINFNVSSTESSIITQKSSSTPELLIPANRYYQLIHYDATTSDETEDSLNEDEPILEEETSGHAHQSSTFKSSDI